MKLLTLGACALLIPFATSGASAQIANEVDNPSFETPDPGNPALPEWWSKFNTARYRTSGDGLGAFFAHSGDASIEFPSGTDFSGFTTDVFDPGTLEYNNPPFVWDGGDVVVTGYYLIPADQPLDGASSGIKLEFRRPNLSIFAAFEDLSITGHTNGQWQCYQIVVTQADLDPFEMFPELPVKCTVLPLRFGSAGSTGTIFWDDIRYRQVFCAADLNNDSAANGIDIGLFLQGYSTGDCTVDMNHDGNLNGIDVGLFLQAYSTGC